MILLEKWVPLVPNNIDVSKSYIFESFINGPRTFEIVLIDNTSSNKKILINFPYRAFAYRTTKIEFQESTLEVVRRLKGNDFFDWPFFKIDNSHYIEWLVKQSCGINQIHEFDHFVFLSQDVVIEVINSSNEPNPIVSFC